MKSPVLDNEDDIASKAVLCLMVIDPCAPRKIKTTANIQESTSSDIIDDVTRTKIREHADVVEILDRNEDDDNTFSCRSLWDACSGVISPLEESVLSREKNELHKNFFCLNDPNATKVQSLRCCPIFLLKDENKKGLTTGVYSLKFHQCYDKLLAGHDTSLDGFVARTSSSLTNFLHEIKGNHLLLFPQVAKRKTCFSKLVKDESKLGQAQNGISNIVQNSKLCFLRVLLHAYKEGSFEEGAVVCAPQLTDITLWTSGPENIEGGLQIPQSAVTSYFKELSSR